ncbi:cupin domain-containing protein [Pseudoflavitalea sp. G-6-1-2]|uniref:cupin domain-containing protein n=1 Tax=Pseudoflavitalea sp. G-6-1-2 TaxID=2728841 RepID=UPI00146E116B|nr:cupin domain-containing protein [Pseudoflavitalea sp. G-6-1-2]NML23818.1 cupin domain-containing protein [Pseudoflavitalea sp. G-6-1-2]
MDAKTIIDWFGMQPNTAEGGYYAPVYTSKFTVSNKELPGFKPVKPDRPICSAIYYLIDAESFSAMHRVTGNMLYHFYSGDPVQVLLLYPEGSPNRWEIFTFSNDVAAGGCPMKVIPGGTWMGSRMIAGGNYALMGVSMDSGFNPADYTIAKRKELIKEYPEQKDLITALTRS